MKSNSAIIHALIFIGSLLLLPTPYLLQAATINSFQVTPAAITFPDQDPDLFPEVQSQTDLRITFTMLWLYQPDQWQLDFLANGNLLSGASSIPVANVRWHVTPLQVIFDGTFQDQNLANGVYRNVGTGVGWWLFGYVNVQIDVTFYLQNSWDYNAGDYSGPVTVRLSCPGDVRTATFNLTTSIAPRAKLDLGYSAIQFPDANPDTTPSIAALQNPVPVTASSRNGNGELTTLTCRANSDLISAPYSIAIANVTWTASGSGFTSGTMSSIANQNAGQWTGSGRRTGSFSYSLANSWNYNSGSYSATVVYTLTAL